MNDDERIIHWMRGIMSNRPPAPRIDAAIEPRMTDERGPQGDPAGAGRGELTPRQEERLNAIRGFWLAGHMD